MARGRQEEEEKAQGGRGRREHENARGKALERIGERREQEFSIRRQRCVELTHDVVEEHGGSALTMDPACAAPEEGAVSGEQPEERPNRPVMEMWLDRLNVRPKRQRWRNGERKGERAKQDSAVKTLCTLSCTCLQPSR